MDSEEVAGNTFHQDPDDVDDMDFPEDFDEDNPIVDVNSTSLDNETEATTTDLKSTEQRLINLPLSKIRSIMKLDSEMGLASAESVFLITKATEMFIDSLAKESFVHTAQSYKKTVQKKDIEAAIASVEALMFLEGAMNF